MPFSVKCLFIYFSHVLLLAFFPVEFWEFFVWHVFVNIFLPLCNYVISLTVSYRAKAFNFLFNLLIFPSTDHAFGVKDKSMPNPRSLFFPYSFLSYIKSTIYFELIFAQSVRCET